MSERRSSPTQTPSRGHQQRVSMRRCACRTGIHAWPDGTFGPPACVCPVWWAAWRVGVKERGSGTGRCCCARVKERSRVVLTTMTDR